MKVSVLITSRNRPDVLCKCVENVIGQDYSDFEIVVLDDASDEVDLCRVLAERFNDPRLRCLRSDIQLGVAGARNRLAKEATGDILCFIDDDAVFENPYAIMRLTEIFELSKDIGIVACKIMNHCPGGSEMLVPFSRRWLRHMPGIAEQAQDVSYYVGTCHAIRYEVFKRCGMYADHLMYGEEELDLSYRVVSTGYRIYYEPSVVVHHYPQPSVVAGGKEGDSKELYHHIQNRLYLAYRYLPIKYIPIYLTIWLGFCFLESIRRGMFGIFFAGVRDGITQLWKCKRAPIDKRAERYLYEHYGRLWY